MWILIHYSYFCEMFLSNYLIRFRNSIVFFRGISIFSQVLEVLLFPSFLLELTIFSYKLCHVSLFFLITKLSKKGFEIINLSLYILIWRFYFQIKVAFFTLLDNYLVIKQWEIKLKSFPLLDKQIVKYNGKYATLIWK